MRSHFGITDELKAKITACFTENRTRKTCTFLRTKSENTALPLPEKKGLPVRVHQGVEPQTAAVASLDQEAANIFLWWKAVQTTVAEALKGASDPAEEVAEKVRSYACGLTRIPARSSVHLTAQRWLSRKVQPVRDVPELQIRVKNAAPHNLLALCRSEGVFNFSTSPLIKQFCAVPPELKEITKTCNSGLLPRDAQGFNRLMKASLIGEVKKTYADFESIKTFEGNLRELLLFSCWNETDFRQLIPISLDWVACCCWSDRKFLEYLGQCFPHQAVEQRLKAAVHD